jgi:DNA-binding CsgD family transcriptional regulator/tetratricopeptide (TPR) repeat protein
VGRRPRAPACLRGRRTECAALDRILSDATGGTSRVLVLRGEPGVGKTALLGYLAERVEGGHVASAAGVESETELAYSGLHQLCAPLLDDLHRLPVPQRGALETVFGLGAGPAPDRFLVGLAALTLLAEAAERQPVVCLVDDGQWLDRATAQILAFVARRLCAERVALVCAARTGTGDDVLAGLPALPVPGLDEPDARALLLANVPGPLDAAVGDQIVAESRGNPRALLELPRTWTAADLAGGYGLPAAGRVEDAYRRRLLPLPPETQLLVLAAAAEPLGNPVLLHGAARALGIDLAAAAPATDAGLLQIAGRVRFAHPLVRSASYHAATADDRYRVHRALAEATDPVTDPDRRAWHRARACPGPDEEVAAELERRAGRARSRGGIPAVAAFLTRAAELTPAPAQRVRRALDAAFANVEAGAFDTARTLLAITRDGPLDEWQRARTELLRAQLAAGRGGDATPLLLAAARRLEPLDAGLARRTYLDAFCAAQLGAGGAGVGDVARAAGTAPRPRATEATAADLLLDAFTALTGDYRAALPACRAALGRLHGAEVSVRELRQGCVLALELWDDDGAYRLSERHLRVARATGALGDLPAVPVLVLCGELSAAAALVEGAAFDEYTRAVLGNGSGEYEEALAAARRACQDPRGFVTPNWALPELIESATRTGRADLAAEALDRLARKARAAGTRWALGIEARSRALLSDGTTADGLYRAAIEHLAGTRIRGECARAHLLYGEWLRRGNRRADARAELGTAYELFTALGLAGFAERTRRELQATGATVRKRTLETRDDLTAQEAQIVRLAGDGLSNPEIGAQLFISARTVEWHLRKVFTKLGISSRRQLRRGSTRVDAGTV